MGYTLTVFLSQKLFVDSFCLPAKIWLQVLTSIFTHLKASYPGFCDAGW